MGSSVGALLYRDTGLSNGQTYYYKVSAKNAIGEGLKTGSSAETPKKDNDLVGYWNLNEGSGESSQDAGDNNNDGRQQHDLRADFEILKHNLTS